MNLAARLAAILMLAPLGAAAAGDFAACVGVQDAAARLACYDRAAGRAAPVVALPAPAPVVTPAAPPRAEPAPTAGPASFGAETLPRSAKEKAAELDALRARIKGRFTQWKHGARLELDNGQVWKVVTYDSGSDPRIPPDPAVTITKSAIGGYWMEIDGTGRSLRVRRVQ